MAFDAPAGLLANNERKLVMDDATVTLPNPKRKYRKRGEPKPGCSVAGCERLAATAGKCGVHHLRFQRYGRDHCPYITGTAEERFERRVIFAGNFDLRLVRREGVWLK